MTNSYSNFHCTASMQRKWKLRYVNQRVGSYRDDTDIPKPPIEGSTGNDFRMERRYFRA